MLKVIAAGLMAATLLVAACTSDSDDSSNGFSCENAKSKCPNDPPLPVDVCKQALGHPTCGSHAMAFFLCIGEHQTCLSDGTTDQSVTDRECAMQRHAIETCDPMVDAGGGD